MASLTMGQQIGPVLVQSLVGDTLGAFMGWVSSAGLEVASHARMHSSIMFASCVPQVSISAPYLEDWRSSLLYKLFVTVLAVLVALNRFGALTRAGFPFQTTVCIGVFDLIAGWLAVYALFMSGWICFLSPFDGCMYTPWINAGFLLATFGDLLPLGMIPVLQNTSLECALKLFLGLALAVRVLVWYNSHVLSIQQELCEPDFDAAALFDSGIASRARADATDSSSYVFEDDEVAQFVSMQMAPLVGQFFNILLFIALAAGLTLSLVGADPTGFLSWMDREYASSQSGGGGGIML